MSNQTQTDDRQTDQDVGDGQSKGQLSTDFRIPYKPELYKAYGIKRGDWLTLIDVVWPSAKTFDGVHLALSWCRSKGYTQLHEIMRKPCHVVPVWNSQLRREVEGVWPAISETRITAHRTGLYAGCDETSYGPMKTHTFKGDVKDKKTNSYVKKEMSVTFPEWAQVTVYRIVQGQRVAFPGPRITYMGNYGARGQTDLPNDKWAEAPEFMLDKCAEAAALRKAFPECDQMPTAEEMEGRKVPDGGVVIDNDPQPEPQPPKPTRDQVEKARKEEAERQAQYRQQMAKENGADPDTGEVRDDPPPAEDDGREPVKPAANYDGVDWTKEYKAMHTQIVGTGRDQAAFENWQKNNQAKLEAMGKAAPEQRAKIMETIDGKAKFFAENPA